jgi:RNA polymerase sigma-70 factor (ECF subfamily)
LSHPGVERHLSHVSARSEIRRLPFPRPGSASSLDVDDAVLEAAFAACERRLGRYLAQFVQDRTLAEDLLQETYVAALRSREVTTVANPEAWLFGIARNRALDALRRRRRFQGALTRLPLRREHTDDEDALIALRDLLERTLSPEDRSLVLLRYLHEFDAAELALMTGMTAEAVRQRLSRARRKLLAAATDEGGVS